MSQGTPEGPGQLIRDSEELPVLRPELRDRNALGRATVTLLVCPVCGNNIDAVVAFATTIGPVTADSLNSVPVTLTPTHLRVTHACAVATTNREI